MAMFKEDDFSKKIKDLSEEIENLKKSSPELNYIDCTVEICEKYNIELETVKKILPKTIKEKIEADALDLNLLKYKIGKII